MMFDFLNWVREQPFNIGGGMGKFGVGISFGPRREGDFFLDPEMGLIFFHASLANIFNKCHKKAVFVTKQLNLGM